MKPVVWPQSWCSMSSIPNTAVTTKRQAPTLRGSSRGFPVCQRPRLMRSSATAPCLATSNASRNDLASLHPASRASVLLNRVASYSLSRQSHDLPGHSDRLRSQSPQRYSRSPHNHEESFMRENRNLCHNGTGHGQSFFLNRIIHRIMD